MPLETTPIRHQQRPRGFQMRLMTSLEGVDGTAMIADDILVYGTGDSYDIAEADPDKNLIALMKRTNEKDIRFTQQN